MKVTEKTSSLSFYFLVVFYVYTLVTNAQISVIGTASNTQNTYTVPSCVCQVTIKCWGGGGGGGGLGGNTLNRGAGGGGGGAFSYATVNVTPGQILYIQAGRKGLGGNYTSSSGNSNDGTQGGESWVRTGSFSGTIICGADNGDGGNRHTNGSGGNGGAINIAASVGDVRFPGGSGGNGASGNGRGGGGGGSAGYGSAGGNGNCVNGGAAGAGGALNIPGYAGPAALGGSCSGSASNSGSNAIATNYGAGGSGAAGGGNSANFNNKTGGDGAPGYVEIIPVTNACPVPVVSITNNTGTNQLSCSIPSISVTASGASTYVWNGGSTPNSANNTFTSAGTYTVNATNANGCSAATVSITITSASPSSAPTITNITGTNQLTCSLTSISVTASGGSNYSWNGGVSPNTATNTFNTPGTYTVTSTDANGCTTSSNIVITSNTTPPTPLITNNTGGNELTCATASVNVTASGGSTYSWDGGNTPNLASNSFTAPGIYSVTVTSSNGCSATSTITITSNTTPPLPGITNNSGTNEINCLVTAINATATSGTSYSWDGGNTPNSASNSFTSSGTYTVNVIGSNGCSATSSITITSNTTPPVPVLTNNSGTTEITCTTPSINVTASGGDLYNWNGGSSSNSDANTFSSAGNYIVTISASNGCTATESITITENISPPTPVINNNTGSDELSCTITTINVEATGGDSYSWDGGNSMNTASNSLTSPGTYTVTVTGSNGCSATESIVITSISNQPTVSINYNSPFCNSETSNAQVTINGTGAYLGGVFSATPTGLALNSTSGEITVNTSNPGTYELSYATPPNGACPPVIATTIFIIDPVEIPTFTQVDAICSGDTFTLPSSSLNNINGTWAPAINNVSTTLYTFTPTAGQCASTQTMTVNVNNPVTPTFGSYGPFCKDAILAQVILPETSNNGIEGTWNPQMLSTANAGTSIYTFTPNSGECATNFELLVVVNPNPQIEAGNNQNICSGNSITLSASGGVQYSWSNSVQNGQPFSPLQTTMYYVTGADLNGCESIDSVLISVTQTPTAEFTSSVSIGQAPLPVDFTNSSTNATSYLWVFGDGNSTNSNDLSTVTNIFNADGDYPVILVASNGSCIDSATLIISVFSDPWIYIPNVFSPNNDEANELWSIQTKNIEQIEVVILNRWGNKVAEIKTLTDGWNGKTPSGDEVTAGSYFYKYKAKGLNGDELDGHGFFTLVR